MTASQERRFLWVFSTFAVGGPQRRFATLLPAFGKATRHFVFAMDDRHDAERLLPEGARVERLSAPVEKTGLVSPANIRRFRSILADVAPDLLLTSNWGTMEWHFANRGAGTAPHIHFEDGFGPDEAAGRRSAKRDIARRLLFSPLSPGAPRRAFVAPSSGLASLFSSAWGADRRAVRLIPNGVDLGRFAIAPPADDAPLTIGSVGALRPEKRFDRLIRAFANGPGRRDAHLLLVGDGPERGALEALASSCGVADRTHFMGEQMDIPAMLARMHLFALSSDTEQMPISLVEAMAAGRAVVATDVGDIRAMLPPEQSGYVIPLKPEADLTAPLATALSDLASDAPHRGRLGAANREAAKRYGLPAMNAAYVDLVETLLAPAGSA